MRAHTVATNVEVKDGDACIQGDAVVFPAKQERQAISNLGDGLNAIVIVGDCVAVAVRLDVATVTQGTLLFFHVQFADLVALDLYNKDVLKARRVLTASTRAAIELKPNAV